MEEDDTKLRLMNCAGQIRNVRRRYNKMLQNMVEGVVDEYNAEDLMRLVGTLEAAYNHLIAAVAADDDIYCALKHLSYAIILAGELNDPDVEELYDIMAILTDGVIEPCAACKEDAEAEAFAEEVDYQIKED